MSLCAGTAGTLPLTGCNQVCQSLDNPRNRGLFRSASVDDSLGLEGGERHRTTGEDNSLFGEFGEAAFAADAVKSFHGRGAEEKHGLRVHCFRNDIAVLSIRRDGAICNNFRYFCAELFECDDHVWICAVASRQEDFFPIEASSEFFRERCAEWTRSGVGDAKRRCGGFGCSGFAHSARKES